MKKRKPVAVLGLYTGSYIGAIDYIFKLTVTPEELCKALRHADAHLVEKPDKADRFLRKNITAIKAYLIQLAAQGSYSNARAMQEDLREVCPGNDFNRPFCVMQISIDTQCGSFVPDTVKDLRLLKYGIENLLGEVMNQDSTAEVYNYYREDLLVVFNTDGFSDYAQLAAYANQKFLLMKEYVQRYYSLAVTGALSRIYTGLAQVRTATQETDRVLIYRIESENGILHTANETQRPEIVAVKQYIQSHLAQELSLEVAAKEVNMSQSYFSHLFKDEMKLSFTDYVNRVRMRRACQLLQNPRLKINEVAAHVGIENFNYFSVLFKKVTGLSPNAYREQAQESAPELQGNTLRTADTLFE